MLLVLSSISCFLCWQLPCYHRHTATALGALSPVFATSVPREIPGATHSSTSNSGLSCACLLQQAQTVHVAAADWLFVFIQNDLHPRVLGTRAAQDHREAQSKLAETNSSHCQ